MDNDILIFSKEFYPYASGSGINAKYFAEYLVRKNRRVKVLTLNYYFRLPSFEEINGVPVERVPMIMMNRYFVRLLAPLLVFPFYVKHIIQSQRVMIYGPLVGYLGVILLCAIFKKKVYFQSVLMDGDDIKTILEKHWYMSFLVKKILSLLNLYHAITPQFKTIFQNNISTSNVRILNNSQGVDTSIFHSVSDAEKNRLRQKLNLPLHKQVYLSVGNVIERKGYREIFDKLKEKTEDFLYVIIGNYNNNRTHFFWHNGEEMKALYDYGNKVLKERIRFVGFKDNVHEYLKASDVLLHNGLQEGYPNVLLEAEACGVYTVSPNYITLNGKPFSKKSDFNINIKKNTKPQAISNTFDKLLSAIE